MTVWRAVDALALETAVLFVTVSAAEAVVSTATASASVAASASSSSSSLRSQVTAGGRVSWSDVAAQGRRRDAAEAAPACTHLPEV